MKASSSDNQSLLTDRVRLSLMAAIAAAAEPIEFVELLNRLSLTKGNLSSHLRKLEEAQLIEVEKSFLNRKSRTTYRCTDLGRKALEQQLNELEQLILSIKNRAG